MIHRSIRRATRWAGLLLVGGCSASVKGPNLGALYDRAASFHGVHRNPVIVIPGVLGSKLVDEESGRVVWGAFTGGYANPEKPDGARLVALPMREGAPLRALRDRVRNDGALDRLRVSLFGLPLDLAAYVNILRTLGIGGYRDEQLGRSGAIDYGKDHFTCFQFDYDWRRDLVESAMRLNEFILAKRAYVQREIEKRYGAAGVDVKFDIVAHSMGGLVARYYLRYGGADLPDDGSLPPLTWAGAKYVERVVLIAAPNAGSVKSLMELVNGVSFSSMLPTYPAAVLGTMPSAYQLLPRPRHRAVVYSDKPGEPPVDLFDLQTWQRLDWGLTSQKRAKLLADLLPDVTDEQERHRIAVDHLRKCLDRARQFQAAIDVPSRRPPGLEIHLFAGDAIATQAVVHVDSDSGRLGMVDRRGGDGTVLRSSALMDERMGRTWIPRLISPIDWSSVTFLFADHFGLTKDPVFHDNMLYLLLEQPMRARSSALKPAD